MNATDNRNYGIDLLRIIAMLMVIVLHIMRRGGALHAASMLSVKYEIGWLLEIMTFCAVNCYALISGYVNVTLKYKYSNIIKLWLQVFFLTILITIVFAIFLPNSVGLKSWIKACFPVLTNQYWYFTAYVCLYIFMPFINSAMLQLSQKQLKMLIILLVLLFSCFNTIHKNDALGILDGYNAMWIIFLYIIGAYIRIYDRQINVTVLKAIIGYILCVAITWFSKFVVELGIFKLADPNKYRDVFINYTSPTILMSAIFLFFIFKQITINNKLGNMVKLLSSFSFNVYIIHTQPLVWEHIIFNRMESYVKLPTILFVLAIIGTAMGIYAVCSMIDMIRRFVFKKIKIDQKISEMEKF